MDCRIRFKGYLSRDWQHCFAGLEITHEIMGTTLLSGELPDQAALYAVLLTIRRLGLTLLDLSTEDALSLNIAKESSMDIQPFHINIPEDTLEDLRTRLAHTRWPDEAKGTDWKYGTDLKYLQELVAFWQNEYDWREQESKLNQFAQYKADVDGTSIHFIHVRGKGPNPTPLLLLHGWPDSFYRFYKVIPLLTDPASFGGKAEDAFDVIVPSLPGFGFSDRPNFPGGMKSLRTAAHAMPLRAVISAAGSRVCWRWPIPSRCWACI